MIANLFSGSGNDHPLAGARGVKDVLAALPAGDDLKSLDEIAGWLESLCNADKLRPEQLLLATRQLDETGQVLLRRVTRSYLALPGPSRADEQRIWALCSAYCHHAALLYAALCIAGAPHGEVKAEARKAAEALKPQLPCLLARQIAALAAFGKWQYFRYERLPGEFWQRLGAAYLHSERLGLANAPVRLYPGAPGTTTALQQYARFLAFAASSPDSLSPLGIELAERLIAHSASFFVLGAVDRPDNRYWIDAALGHPPQRLVKVLTPTPTLRLLALGSAADAVAELSRTVERGDVPADLALGGQYPARAVLPVLRHLAACWAAQPPLRQHQRHPVKTGKLRALQGFERCLRVVRGDAVSDGEAEIWRVENVSLGGLGAVLPGSRRDPLRIGELVVVQPEGGDNWLIAVVRRYGRDRDAQAAGLQTLSKQASLLTLRLCGGQRYGAERGDPAILLGVEGQESAVRLLLPATTFDLSESYDSRVDGKPALLSPIELLEAGRDYQIGRYRLRYAE